MNIWEIRSTGAEQTRQIGEILGGLIQAVAVAKATDVKKAMADKPEVIELRSDLGGGKTTFTQGLVRGLGSADRVASPTFTLNKVYKTPDLEIHHFDFYRLVEPGVVRDQLQESLQDLRVVTVVEWSDIVKDVLPQNRITVEFKPVASTEDERTIVFGYPDSKMPLIEKLRAQLEEVEP